MLLEEILTIAEFNWYGYAWDKHPPPPTLRKGGSAYLAAVNAHAELTARSQPAPVDALAGIFYRLQGHYWTPQMTEALAKSVAADYTRLLGGKYSVDEIQAACDDWLMNPENRFFPKPGEIDAILKRHRFAAQYRLKKLQRLLDLAD